MTETLYLDLFFLVNLFADLYLLFLTGMILREPVRRRKGRLFLGATVGAAVGCVLVFFPKLPLPVWILLELAIPALLMTQVAFGRCSLLETLRRVTVLGLTAVLSGGVFAALWEMAEGAGVGLTIDMKKLPLRQETVEVCEFCNVNPYELRSGGSLIIASPEGTAVVEALAAEGIPAVIVGRFTDSNERLILNEDEVRYMDRPQRDEIYKETE